jgi:hypothetical protein
MNRQAVAKELVAVARDLTAGDSGFYYYQDRNGLIVWSTRSLPATVNLLDKVMDAVDPTDEYEWHRQVRTTEGTAGVWKWYGLFGMTRDVARELERRGFTKRKIERA